MRIPLEVAWMGLWERGADAGRVAADRSEIPVLFLPGFASSPRMLTRLERSVRSVGRPTRCVALGSTRCDIRDSACRVYDLLENEVEGPRLIDLVGHSMGGLVATYLLKCLDQGRRIRRVVTLGTPHAGVPLARFPGPAWLCTSVRQMRPGSAFLTLLARLPLPEGSQMVSVAGGCDRLVPPEATQLPDCAGHSTRLVAGADHWDLLVSAETRLEVCRALGGLAGVSQLEVARGPTKRAS